MKSIGIVCTLAFIVLMVWAAVAEVFAEYDYENHIGSYWSLSDKASSLDQKADYLDKFVAAIENSRLADHDAVFFKTPDNSVEQNMIALKSLQKRMHEIKGMDVQSFQYQQAISQITAQEQGEAGHLLSVFKGAWYLENHPLLWDWYDVLKWLGCIVFVCIALCMAFVDDL